MFLLQCILYDDLYGPIADAMGKYVFYIRFS